MRSPKDLSARSSAVSIAPLMNGTTATFIPWPRHRKAIPSAAVVFPLPAPVWTISKPFSSCAASIRRSTEAFNRCIRALYWSSSVTLDILSSPQIAGTSLEPPTRGILQFAVCWQNADARRVPEHSPQRARPNPCAPLVHHGVHRHIGGLPLEPVWNSETHVRALCYQTHRVCSSANTPTSCI